MLGFRQTGPGLESSVPTQKESSIGTLLNVAKLGPCWSLDSTLGTRVKYRQSKSDWQQMRLVAIRMLL